ncbi:ISL3-like element ISVsp17 family transposase [Verrucomicrobium spinosum]|uniref:ISL3-like element ISVsp17 family transposase n=1 Tax=Verrucomicrobium spinosum TaxID=2736 RepID=UPI0001746B26|nr:ISL3-like element ISVsp17 family transposase [Verrucomicrobium spinosum]
MDQNSLFEAALGLTAPWKVIGSGLERDQSGKMFLCLEIEVQSGAKLPCPCCSKLCTSYDHELKRWRHLNFWQHATYLSARVPRVDCPEHGVRQVEVPWARAGSGFTLMFEALVMALSREMPVSAVAGLVGETDTRLWRVVHHYVGQAHASQDWSEVHVLAIDETATRKGHRYATVAVDLRPETGASARLLFMTPGRSGECVELVAQAMPAHGAQPSQVKVVAIDLSPAYQKGAAEHFPAAQVVFDRFHVMKLAQEATDAVRKQLHRMGADVKGGLWALRGNWEGLKASQKQLRDELCARYKEIGRALALREHLQETWEWPGVFMAEHHLKRWCQWADRSRLESFRKLSRTIKKHWAGILAYYPNRVTSAAIEAINGILQTARRRARGFRNFANFQAIAYWMAGDLDLKLRPAFTHP